MFSILPTTTFSTSFLLNNHAILRNRLIISYDLMYSFIESSEDVNQWDIMRSSVSMTIFQVYCYLIPILLFSIQHKLSLIKIVFSTFVFSIYSVIHSEIDCVLWPLSHEHLVCNSKAYSLYKREKTWTGNRTHHVDS